MKSAMLITAYRDFDALLCAIEYYSAHYCCYIHVDKKVEIPADFRQAVSKLGNVRVIQKYPIFWGSYKHILAFVELMRLAIDDGCEYFHLIPADTFPVKDIATTNAFFEENRNKNYIEMLPAQEDPDILQRQSRFHFQHIYNLKSDKGYNLQNRLLKLQKKLGIRKKPKMQYKGYLYCHLCREFACYVIRRLGQDRAFLGYLKTCSIAEEFFFQNLVAQTEFTVESDHLLYDLWEEGSGGPSALTQAQVDDAIRSNRFFARKILGLEMVQYVLRRVNTEHSNQKGDNNE